MDSGARCQHTQDAGPGRRGRPPREALRGGARPCGSGRRGGGDQAGQLFSPEPRPARAAAWLCNSPLPGCPNPSPRGQRPVPGRPLRLINGFLAGSVSQGPSRASVVGCLPRPEARGRLAGDRRGAGRSWAAGTAAPREPPCGRGGTRRPVLWQSSRTRRLPGRARRLPWQ